MENNSSKLLVKIFFFNSISWRSEYREYAASLMGWLTNTEKICRGNRNTQRKPTNVLLISTLDLATVKRIDITQFLISLLYTLFVDELNEGKYSCRFEWVLTTEYNILNYWGFGLCPSSGILETREHKVSETGSVSILRWRGEAHTCALWGPLKRATKNVRVQEKLILNSSETKLYKLSIFIRLNLILERNKANEQMSSVLQRIHLRLHRCCVINGVLLIASDRSNERGS
jgi:hypothetical protein